MNGVLSYQRPRLKPFVIGGAVLLVALAALVIPALWKISRVERRDLAQADTAVAKFHQQLDEGGFDQIFNDSDNEFKRVATQEKFVEFLSAIHRKLGSVKSTAREGFFLDHGTLDEKIRLTYSTQFENDLAKEQFVFRVNGGDLGLLSYHIKSAVLIAK